MPLLDPQEPLPQTYRRDNVRIWRDITALWKAVHGAKTPLSNDDPAPVGNQASAGGSEEASRSDHVHVGGTGAGEVLFAYDYMVIP